jgi:uncharacterized protein with HEPN domain
MARDVSAYLQDVLDACNSIEDVMSGVSLDEYRSKRAVRSAVEREFIIIGEALREALGNKAVKRSLHADLFQMDVLGAD